MGPFFIPKASVKNDSYFLTACEKLPQEKLHLKFCKYIYFLSACEKLPQEKLHLKIGKYIQVVNRRHDLLLFVWK